MVDLLGASRDRHVEQGVAEILGGFSTGLGEQFSRDVLDGLAAFWVLLAGRCHQRLETLEAADLSGLSWSARSRQQVAVLSVVMGRCSITLFGAELLFGDVDNCQQLYGRGHTVATISFH